MLNCNCNNPPDTVMMKCNCQDFEPSSSTCTKIYFLSFRIVSFCYVRFLQ